jgi:hypothetical protein
MMNASDRAPIYAFLTERGPKNVAMQAGTNIRIFNEVELHADGYMENRQNTGYLTLHPGICRLHGWSVTILKVDKTKPTSWRIRTATTVWRMSLQLFDPSIKLRIAAFDQPRLCATGYPAHW